ncbi:hypothetical protein ACIQXW_03500 [Lysinibacillus sp. NPDC097162]|uniref:hypothetical protein n=1 Tax=Lysinibacillus sp. NPDC097162 TaxID=3364140 RepID=UPI0038250CE7
MSRKPPQLGGDKSPVGQGKSPIEVYESPVGQGKSPIEVHESPVGQGRPPIEIHEPVESNRRSVQYRV